MVGTVTGVFESAEDSDWFRVRMEAGKVYEISSTGAPLIGVTGEGGVEYRLQEANGKRYFAAPMTGDYFLSATDYYYSETHYSIEVKVVQDVYKAGISTTLSLDVGETISVSDVEGNISGDWFAMELTAGQSYFLSGDWSLYLGIFDAAGVAIDNMAFGGNHFTPTQSGRYYVGAYGSSSYTLSLTAVADDRGEMPATAGAVAIGGTVRGMAETADDTDWFAVTLKAGTRYGFSVDGSARPALLNAQGQNASLIQTTDDQFMVAADGVYYVAVTGWQAGTYTLSATVAAPLATPSAASTVQVGQAVAAPSGSGDAADWYKVTLTAGQIYSFAVSGSTDATLTLRDAWGDSSWTGNAQSDGTVGLNVYIQSSGTYYFAVDAAAYTVTTSVLAGDHAATIDTDGRLTVGQIITDKFEASNDRDWFAVDLEAGKSYAFVTDRDDNRLILRDADGRALTDDDGTGRHFSPTVTGVYYLEARGWTPEYLLGVVEIADDAGTDPIHAGVIRRPAASTTGNDVFISTADHDAFIGQAGDDRFVAGVGYDLFDGGAGTDLASFTEFNEGIVVDLRAGGLLVDGVVKVTLSSVETILGTVKDDDIVGDAGANDFRGGKGNDLLDGGVGADVLDGGWGNDRLLGGKGDDVLIGGAGDDILNGGEGADRMEGGIAEDVYVVNSTADIVIERPNEGVDRVNSSVSYSLRSTHVEILRLIGTANIDGTGNALDNVLVGNHGDNVLDGLGGADLLVGHGGADMFLFSVRPNGGDVDRIADFSLVDDSIGLDAAIFRAGPAGVLRAQAFYVGAAAHDATDRIIYNSATGALYYDADGSGAGAAVQFAEVSAGLAMTNADFVIV
jgi:Ca2+-binding RTX toxin-like protein